MATESKSKRNTDYNAPFAIALRGLIEATAKNQGKKESDIVGELAAVTGATRQAISQYKNGIVAPNTEKLCQISDYFHVSTDFMLGRTNVWSGNADDEAVHDRLGLSQPAINELEKLYKTFKWMKDHHGDNKQSFDCEPIVGQLRAINFLLENRSDILYNMGMLFSSTIKQAPEKEVVCTYYEATQQESVTPGYVESADVRVTTFKPAAWLDLHILNIVDALRASRQEMETWRANLDEQNNVRNNKNGDNNGKEK